MTIVAARSGLLAVVQLRQSGLQRADFNRKENLEDDRPDDMTGQGVKDLLADLANLSGQEAAERPALELLIGDILTRTSVEPAGLDLYLCVTGLLPPCEISLPPSALARSERDGYELLWHADYGRYIVVRKIPLRTLEGERGVMDEILNTADLAQGCLREITGK